MRRRTGVRAALLACFLLVIGTHSTAAPIPGTVHFTTAGDFSASANALAVFDKIDELDSDLTITLGDLSYGTAGQEQAWCDQVTSRVGEGYPFELLAGNHESNGQNGNINDFSACLPNQLPGVKGVYGRQYYVDVPQNDPIVRFINISPGLPYPDGNWNYPAGSARYNWTKDKIDTAQADGIPWIVVSMHKPCITVGIYTCESGADLFNLLLAEKVDLVLGGHEHGYQRSHQLTHRTGCTSLTPNQYNANCVIDNDDAFAKGAGTVAAVVGTGGVGQREVFANDPEADYFAATAGSNLNQTFGVLDVKATDDRLTAKFERATGGTLADTFTITRGAPNEPPVAAFTSNCTDLACTFDGSGSSDPDGTITGYAWNFGDNSSGTGAAPSHTYAAAGAYPVTLTVTDNGGVARSLTKNVTVTGGAITTYVSDTFTRTVASGFGSTAPAPGGAWTHAGGNTNFSVNGSQGLIRVAAGAGPTAYLAGVNAPSADLTTTVSLDKVPAGGTMYLSILGRRVGAEYYSTKIKISASGSTAIELVRKPATGAEVVLQSSIVVPGTYAVGDSLNVRLQAIGSNPTLLQAKVWEVGTTEPISWQRSVSDSTPGLQTGGSVGIYPYLSGGATNAPVTVRIDELTVKAAP